MEATATSSTMLPSGVEIDGICCDIQDVVPVQSGSGDVGHLMSATRTTTEMLLNYSTREAKVYMCLWCNIM